MKLRFNISTLIYSFTTAIIVVGLSVLIIWAINIYITGRSVGKSLESTDLVTSESIETSTKTVTPKSPTPTPTGSPTIPTASSTVSPTYTSTSTPTPTYTPTPTHTPTATVTPITGEVITEDYEPLNVREKPGTCHRIIDRLESGAKINILGRIPTADAWDWLQIDAANEQIGYVSLRYVEIASNNDLEVIDELVAENCTPTPPPPPPFPPEINVGRDGDVRNRSISATLKPFEEHWYTFFDKDPGTVIVFIFKPNVNFIDDNFVGYNMLFFLHNQNQIPVWPPGDTKVLEDIATGAGHYPGVDRNGDLSTGELVWRGGSLNTRYYLRVVNRTEQTVEYCLVPGDVFSWVCD